MYRTVVLTWATVASAPGLVGEPQRDAERTVQLRVDGTLQALTDVLAPELDGLALGQPLPTAGAEGGRDHGPVHRVGIGRGQRGVLEVEQPPLAPDLAEVPRREVAVGRPPVGRGARRGGHPVQRVGEVAKGR